MSNINPSSAYRELGRQLLQIREAAGLTTRQLADKADVTKTQISRMENGRRISSAPDVILYVMHCGLTLIEAKPLVELCRIAERKAGYYISDPKIGGSLQSLIFLESSAKNSIIYEPQVIPGLLQTPSYALAMVADVHSDIEEDRAAGVVRTRIERQRILYLRNAARFTFYIHEQALRLPVGTDETMHEQLLHIVLTAALDDVSVRIVPIEAGARSAFGGAFRLMEFNEYRPVVYLDNLGGGGLVLEDSNYLRSYYDKLPILTDIALDEGQSRECVAELADAYDRGSRQVVADVVEEEQLQRRIGI
jgi:transcriptional regulator with XRE-family HTH domain